jgi:hypothetical protein
MPAAYYDFFRKFTAINTETGSDVTVGTIEADSVTDTATLRAGDNVFFGVNDTLVAIPDTLDEIVLNSATYSSYIPLGTTKLRLEKDLNGVLSNTEIEVVKDPASSITVQRIDANTLQIGSTAPTIPFSQEQIEDMAANLLTNGTHTDLTVTYQDNAVFPNTLTQDSTTGSGTSAVFDVTVINNAYGADIDSANPGSGYAPGDTVTFLGTNFPNGATPANDLVVTVGTVDGSGGITGLSSVAGTPPLSDNIDLAVTSTLQTVTGRGASTSNAVSITNATSSTDTTTGALKLTAGGLAVNENINAGGYVKATTFESTQTTGTAPFTVASTTEVTNLHADTASTWHDARTVTFAGGDVSGSFTIDGSADVTNVVLTVDADTVALGTDTTGDYVAGAGVSGNGLSGSASGEGSTFTVSSNATSVNTAETIVFRDASGNFSAGTITATISGNVTGNLTGNADTATKWATTRTITMSGDVSADAVNIDGTGNVTITNTVVANDSHTHNANNLTGTTLNSGVTSSSLTSVGTLTALTVSGLSTLAESTEVLSSLSGATGTVVHNLNNGAIFYHTSPAANWTANFTNVPTTNDRTVSVSLVIVQGGTARIPNAVQIGGAAQTIEWYGGTAPTGNANQVDVVSFTLIRVGSAWTVLGSLATYA